jgi:hypothetical protein
MTDPKPKLRWFQYSLRTLLVLVTLCAFACSWLAVKLKQAKQQREAVEQIVKLGGEVEYDWQFDEKWTFATNAKMPTPQWLRSQLGDDLFQSVIVVEVYGTEVTDAVLEHLKGLSQLRWLFLDGTQVTDAGVKKLQQALPNCNISPTPYG